VITIILSLLRI